MSRVVLLGPQQYEPTAGRTLQQLGISGRVAMITAGWQEWEADDEPLAAQVGPDTVNLGLYAQGEAVWSADPELRLAHRAMQDDLRQLRRLYNRRLAHLAAAWIELLAERGPEALLGPERAQALSSIQALDAHHLSRITEMTSDFDEKFTVRDRAAVQRGRSTIEKTLSDCEAVVIEGGHVAVLRNRMRLFGLPDLLGDRTVLACSGAAMVLGERIVLFHDDPPSGPGHTEVALTGLSMYSGLVPLPHARARLRLGEELRVLRLARRFAPDQCVVLEAGTRIDWDGERWTPVVAARLDSSGSVQPWEAVA